jgi:hypothetical protein
MENTIGERRTEMGKIILLLLAGLLLSGCSGYVCPLTKQRSSNIQGSSQDVEGKTGTGSARQTGN